MTELTLQNHRRTMWHFIPGLALSAVITGVALWAALSCRCRRGVQRPDHGYPAGYGYREYHLSTNMETMRRRRAVCKTTFTAFRDYPLRLPPYLFTNRRCGH